MSHSLIVRWIAAYALALVLLVFPVLYAIDGRIADWHLKTSRITFGGAAAFIFLALVPGVVAAVYHLVTVAPRRKQNFLIVDAYYAWRNNRNAALNSRQHQKGLVRTDDPFRGPVSAIAATMLLVSVFLFVAIIATYLKWTDGPLRGIVFAGLGSYVAVLYFMVSRIYASALSSRFLMTSAVGAASAIAMGWVFAWIGLKGLDVDTKSFNLDTILFLTGLFHKWAFDALRRRAQKLFGQPAPETAELSVTSIEGIDDVHADLLLEYGVSTVQQLATAEPGELCERTLLPLDRICEWIDQALLVSYLQRSIVSARSLGIRSAVNLVLVHRQAIQGAPGPMWKLLDSLSEKTSLPRAAIAAIAAKLEDDYRVRLVYAIMQGKEL